MGEDGSNSLLGFLEGFAVEFDHLIMARQILPWFPMSLIGPVY